MFKIANQILAGSVGSEQESARFAKQAESDSLSKVAEYAKQPGVTEHVLALMDAESLLGE